MMVKGWFSVTSLSVETNKNSQGSERCLVGADGNALVTAGQRVDVNLTAPPTGWGVRRDIL